MRRASSARGANLVGQPSARRGENVEGEPLASCGGNVLGIDGASFSGPEPTPTKSLLATLATLCALFFFLFLHLKMMVMICQRGTVARTQCVSLAWRRPV